MNSPDALSGERQGGRSVLSVLSVLSGTGTRFACGAGQGKR